MRTLLLSAGLVGALGATRPAPLAGQPAPVKVVVNKDKQGTALAGYDAVSYFGPAGPVKGDPAITASHLGGTYRFSTVENRDLFLRDPARYLPQYGGYCGYGASRGYLAPVDPEAYTIMGGRLILQNSKAVLGLWNKDPEGRLRLADGNWPGIVEREGRPLP